MKKWGGEGGEKGRGEEGKEPPPENQENLGEKLRRIAGKRGGQTTPVLTFQAQFSSGGGAQYSSVSEVEEKNPVLSWTASVPPGASARTIAATVWELHQYDLPITKMYNGGGGGGGGGSRRNHRYQQLHHLHHHHHLRHHLLEDNPDPSPASPELGSASSLRRHVAASMMQHNRTIQRNHNDRNAVRAVSPASYGSSSMEVAPYNPAVTPTSSIEFKGGNGETSYSLKTSTELLKVLNRIWSLEEQHAANVTLVRALKRELDLSRSKIKELSRDRQSDRHEMEHLVKQIAEDKQGQAATAIQSVKDELEDERKLRKRSETLHRKLARELYESKTSLTTALRELENERRSRVLLEDLCDEFAWGIKTYEQEMHSLKVITPDKGNGSNHRAVVRDRLILHISESWLDERMQTKQETTPLKNSVAEKLSSEIEAFLEAKRKGLQKLGSGSGAGATARRRHSLESIPMNLAASAPPDDGDDDDDVSSGGGGDSPCFELDKPVARGKDEIGNSTTKLDQGKKKLVSQGTGKGRDSSSLQVKFEEQMAQAILGQTKTGEENHVEITEEEVGLNSKYLDSLLKNHYRETGNDFDDSVSKPMWKSHPSPVRGWTTRLPIEDLELSESSAKVPVESKDQTSLKSKLLEARTRGHRSGSRVKTNKVSF
ncbi:uncharacterized protein At5g41620-like [Cynara cardunculus var. scolymus]|uniref:Uncharacterized protein n=1 Tax=Cynara cardunculus var. scolymus TaxID=59895 RepID=A0A124SCZ7_CYNCS|nr:uncharacterized protein At5g41620-like [Cynara cardunculus var. scolymus]KVH95335.1 hypothetical protein Ccrd_002574 [Cynara cardunculus var. scolymus]